MEDAAESREMGPQPLAGLLEKHGLSAHDLVAASEVPMTHKMVARAVKGRRLTKHTMAIVCSALNRAVTGTYEVVDLFNYQGLC